MGKIFTGVKYPINVGILRIPDPCLQAPIGFVIPKRSQGSKQFYRTDISQFVELLE
jgi:hypothetical protein